MTPLARHRALLLLFVVVWCSAILNDGGSIEDLGGAGWSWGWGWVREAAGDAGGGGGRHVGSGARGGSGLRSSATETMAVRGRCGVVWMSRVLVVTDASRVVSWVGMDGGGERGDDGDRGAREIDGGRLAREEKASATGSGWAVEGRGGEHQVMKSDNGLAVASLHSRAEGGGGGGIL